MIPYIVCFSVSVASTFLANNVRFYGAGRRRSRFTSVLFSVIAIGVLCFFAAVRDDTIGYDIAIYGAPAFNTAIASSSLSSFMLAYGTIEPLYMLLTYICAKYANRYVYYFLLQLLVIGPIYLTLQEDRRKKYAWVGMIIYCFWLYAFSLNIMRQSIAIALSLYSYKYIERRRPARYIGIVAFAMGFHATALLSILIYVLNVLNVSEVNEKSRLRVQLKRYRSVSRLMVNVFILVVFAVGGSFISLISQETGRFGALSQDLVSFAIEIPNVFFMAAVLLFMYVLTRNQKSPEISFIIYLVSIGSIIYQLKGMSAQMYRVSMYMTSYMIFGIPLMIEQTKHKNKRVVLAGLVVLFFGYFMFYNVYWLWHSIYPYTSSYLGI